MKTLNNFMFLYEDTSLTSKNKIKKKTKIKTTLRRNELMNKRMFISF